MMQRESIVTDPRLQLDFGEVWRACVVDQIVTDRDRGVVPNPRAAGDGSRGEWQVEVQITVKSRNARLDGKHDFGDVASHGLLHHERTAARKRNAIPLEGVGGIRTAIDQASRRRNAQCRDSRVVQAVSDCGGIIDCKRSWCGTGSELQLHGTSQSADFRDGVRRFVDRDILFAECVVKAQVDHLRQSNLKRCACQIG